MICICMMFARKGVMVVVIRKRSVSFWLTLPDKLEFVINLYIFYLYLKLSMMLLLLQLNSHNNLIN